MLLDVHDPVYGGLEASVRHLGHLLAQVDHDRVLQGRDGEPLVIYKDLKALEMLNIEMSFVRTKIILIDVYDAYLEVERLEEGEEAAVLVCAGGDDCEGKDNRIKNKSNLRAQFSCAVVGIFFFGVSELRSNHKHGMEK